MSWLNFKLVGRQVYVSNNNREVLGRINPGRKEVWFQTIGEIDLSVDCMSEILQEMKNLNKTYAAKTNPNHSHD